MRDPTRVVSRGGKSLDFHVFECFFTDFAFFLGQLFCLPNGFPSRIFWTSIRKNLSSPRTMAKGGKLSKIKLKLHLKEFVNSVCKICLY